MKIYTLENKNEVLCILTHQDNMSYREFKRILGPNGFVIKVVPRPNYLKELREVLFEDTKKKKYNNDETVELFKKHFKLKDVFNLCYTKELNESERKNLAQMSPLSWNSKNTDIDSIMKQIPSEITIDLDILIGLNK